MVLPPVTNKPREDQRYPNPLGLRSPIFVSPVLLLPRIVLWCCDRHSLRRAVPRPMRSIRWQLGGRLRLPPPPFFFFTCPLTNKGSRLSNSSISQCFNTLALPLSVFLSSQPGCVICDLPIPRHQIRSTTTYWLWGIGLFEQRPDYRFDFP